MGEIASGIADVELVSGRQVRFNTDGISEEITSGIGSIFDRHTHGGQVVLEPVLLDLKNGGLLDLGVPVFLATARDLTSERGTNFIFGMTVESWNVSVQSIFRHMQQVMSVPETKNLARQLQHKHNAGFCSDCVSVLRQQ